MKAVTFVLFLLPFCFSQRPGRYTELKRKLDSVRSVLEGDVQDLRYDVEEMRSLLEDERLKLEEHLNRTGDCLNADLRQKTVDDAGCCDSEENIRILKEKLQVQESEIADQQVVIAQQEIDIVELKIGLQSIKETLNDTTARRSENTVGTKQDFALSERMDDTEALLKALYLAFQAEKVAIRNSRAALAATRTQLIEEISRRMTDVQANLSYSSSAVADEVSVLWQTLNDHIQNVTDLYQYGDRIAELTTKLDQVVLKVHCPDGFTPLQDSLLCYMFATEKANWNEARRHCQGKGADLLVLTEDTQIREIAALLKARVDNTHADLWLGATDEATEGDWRWTTGEPVDTALWWIGEPNNANNEDCLHVFVDAVPERFGLNDIRCTVEFNFACQIDSTMATA